jgi:lipopolysaccharide assembly protein A
MTTEPQHAAMPETDPEAAGQPAPGAPVPGQASAPGQAPSPEQAALPGQEPLPGQPGPFSEAPAPTQATPLPQHRIHRTRVSGLWVAIGCFAIVLLLLLIFILQNGRTVDISYMGAHGHLPLGVALLLAAVCGILLVALAGTARILQLRATARRHRRADQKAAASTPPQPGTGPAA